MQTKITPVRNFENSPVNEPEWQWDKPQQEGCHYTPAQTAAVTKAVCDEITRRALPVRVEGPEVGNYESTIPYFEATIDHNRFSSTTIDYCR